MVFLVSFLRQTTQTLRQSYASHHLRSSPTSAFFPLMLLQATWPFERQLVSYLDNGSILRIRKWFKNWSPCWKLFGQLFVSFDCEDNKKVLIVATAGRGGGIQKQNIFLGWISSRSVIVVPYLTSRWRQWSTKWRNEICFCSHQSSLLFLLSYGHLNCARNANSLIRLCKNLS